MLLNILTVEDSNVCAHHIAEFLCVKRSDAIQPSIWLKFESNLCAHCSTRSDVVCQTVSVAVSAVEWYAVHQIIIKANDLIEPSSAANKFSAFLVLDLLLVERNSYLSNNIEHRLVERLREEKWASLWGIQWSAALATLRSWWCALAVKISSRAICLAL